jgi:chromosome segregation ATPase
MLERRRETLDAKVQQKLTAVDSEIAQQVEYLRVLQTRIVEAQDALTRFDRQVEQARVLSAGEARQKETHRSAQTTKIVADHHSAVRAMVADHDSALEREEEAFNETLAHIKAWAEKRAAEKAAGVTQEIGKLQKQITSWKSRKPVADDESETAATFAYFEKWDKGMIGKLETMVRDENAARLDGLLKLKDRLSHCLSTLDELDKAHEPKMKELNVKSRKVDADYEKRLRDVTQKHKKQIVDIQRKIEGAQGEVREIEEAVRNYEKTRTSLELEDAVATETLQREIREATALMVQPAEETRNFGELKAKLAKLEARLASTEAVLDRERTLNNELASRVGRARSEARIAERRAALDI